MEFEVITTATVSEEPVSLTTTPVAIIAPSSHESYDFSDGTAKKEYHIFKAHRVIVAARCEYLRKALLSGMQEDINRWVGDREMSFSCWWVLLCRKITIYDTSPVIFRRFLLYLYGAPVDKNVGLESICELMLLADRYSVDSLKVSSWNWSRICNKIYFTILGGLRADVDVNDRHRQRDLHARHLRPLQRQYFKSELLVVPLSTHWAYSVRHFPRAFTRPPIGSIRIDPVATTLHNWLVGTFVVEIRRPIAFETFLEITVASFEVTQP